jgi:hypothetical protein
MDVQLSRPAREALPSYVEPLREATATDLPREDFDRRAPVRRGAGPVPQQGELACLMASLQLAEEAGGPEARQQLARALREVLAASSAS